VETLPLSRRMRGARRPLRKRWRVPAAGARRIRPTAVFLLLVAAFPMAPHRAASATPPSYKSFHREQQIEPALDAERLLRIWMVFVDQGDGLLIELPPAVRYDADPDDGDPTPSENVEILIDGGPYIRSDPDRQWIRTFLEGRYGDAIPRIELAVVTHHDQDHVAGLTSLLRDGRIEIGRLFHNGLASYRGGKLGFVGGISSGEAIFTGSSSSPTKGMAFFDENGLQSSFLIDTLEELRQSRDRDELHFIYDQLADAVLGDGPEGPVESFERAVAGEPFLAEAAQEQLGLDLADERIAIDLLWPLESLARYDGADHGTPWSYTINGNSVTFRLDYGDFSVLFTGDHNDQSERAFLAHYADQPERLECDVLKVPHHGSGHAIEPFFRRDGARPVLGVASMGDKGFRSKALESGAWQHPADEVVRWLGGAHRAYLTFAHEKRFDWEEVTTEAARRALIERSHILIETDGTWFRVVEVHLDGGDPSAPDPVQEVRRGDGTRWVRARGEA